MTTIFNRTFPQTRLRRIRNQTFSRELIAETTLQCTDLIQPLFICPGMKQKQPIQAMPGQFRWSLDLLLPEVEQLLRLGIRAIALFPVLPDNVRTPCAKAAYDEQGLMATTLQALQEHFPELGLIADVALDPFTTHGQDGLMNEQNEILNDETLEVLVKQALLYAQAGAQVIAPSDMMDGRIRAIRQALESAKLINTQLLSYAAKFASSLYGPFREAIGSAASLGRANKATYQLDPANRQEALHEVALDLQEGADYIMIKPGMFYLDIVRQVKEQFKCPTFVYQVSGEYAMIQHLCSQTPEQTQTIILESLLSCKRAGADAILTYFAKEAAQRLNKSG